MVAKRLGFFGDAFCVPPNWRKRKVMGFARNMYIRRGCDMCGIWLNEISNYNSYNKKVKAFHASFRRNSIVVIVAMLEARKGKMHYFDFTHRKHSLVSLYIATYYFPLFLSVLPLVSPTNVFTIHLV